MSQMEISMHAEYRCGHAPRRLAQQTVDSGYRRKIEVLIGNITKNANGACDLTCRKCGRGAGWLSIKINGETVFRESAEDIAMECPNGVEFSIVPDPELN